MNIAFYAPMKPPDADRPSGDRTIGRLLMAALTHAGCDVRLASRLRTWSGVPDSTRLDAFRAQADHEAEALIASYTGGDQGWRPDVWITYHDYYKAPDLLGARIATGLDIPYVIAEASYSARRAHGPWAEWLSAARAGIGAADAIFNFTARDRAGLADICAVERLHRLPPFLDLDATRPSVAPSLKGARGSSPTTRLVTVAMMRPGAKLASYQLLADSLAALNDLDWHLDIVGDGEARQTVEAAFAMLPAERLCFHGRLDGASIRAVLASGDLFVWPGLEEAFGMAYLEAQAAGLPVAALRTAGVPEVVRHAETGCLADEATPQALAACIGGLINDPDQRRRLGATAQAGVEEHHSLPAASAVLGRVLRQLVVPV